MATYFHGAPPEIQPDGLQTLYLMNPGYVGYTDAAAAAAAAAAPPNMLLFNSTMNSMNPISHQQQQQHFLGVPLQNGVPAPATGHDSNRQYNLWTPVAEGRQPTGQQGLSLSLSSQQAAYAAAYQQSDSDVPNAVTVETASPWTAASSSISGMQGVLTGSKYLKAAQLLLDEVVNVGKGVKSDPTAVAAAKSPVKSSRTSEGGGNGDASSKPSADLSTAERQELQMKKAKLVNMLDEVEQRYRQYRHQMQIVVSTFEAVAGPGSAKSYTALALQTISKQFRCLRDAISGQIKSTSKNLGEELDCVGVGSSAKLEGGGSSRLRLVDHHLRQQRALQQLGMIQNNAWRPQRGLPERSVSILRAWLFEHFLHPYPKDSDKLMLAKQTGLTRSQVSNWFINARVRLWKPMVEEMYLEEVKEHEQANGDDKSKIDHQSTVNGSEESSCKSSSPRTEQTHGGKEKIDHHIIGGHSNPNSSLVIDIPASALAKYGENQALMPSPAMKKVRNDESIHASSLIHHDGTSNCELLMKFGIANQNASFGSYSIGENFGRFDHEQFPPPFAGNGVSLTLGLPPSEPSYIGTDSIGIGIGIGRSLEIGNAGSDFCSINNNPSITQPSSGYDNINIQNRKRFAAQLLPDFVS